MHQKIRNSLLRVVAVFLAFLILFPQIAGLTMPAFAAGSIIKKLEDNPFDGLRWATKQPISGYHGSYPTEIMGVTIDGVNYVAYCLNHDRYGSGDSPTVGEYGVKVYELDDPALQSNEEFINDKNILMYMQGVLASGGYTGGGDSAATALRTRGSSRQLFNNRFEAYGVTKFAMWTLSVGQSDASKWSVNPTATYDASRNQYLLESLNQIMGSANNWNDWVDDEIYAIPKTNSEGGKWQDGPGPGEKYIEWEVTTGYFGNGKVQDSEHVYMAAGGYTLTPGSLPEGFHLEKLDGTEIKSATTMQSQYVNAWLGEPFRLVAESGTDPSSFGEKKTVATIEGKLQTGGLKYGIAEYSGSTKVQNYALVPENGLQAVSAEVKLENEVPEGASIIIRKADGSKNLAGAEFKVTKADSSWSTNVTTGTSGSISVKVPDPGMYYVEETKAPSGYALDSTRYSVEAKSGEAVEIKIENSKSVGLKIQKLDALTDEPLAGAVFTVEQIDGTFSTDVTSNDNGLCVLGGLEPGSYRITEKTPPAGYLPAENPVQTIEIQKDQVEVPMIVYKNEPINGTVKIIKTAENNGEPLAGVTFEIKRRDGAEKWSVVTDENGEAEIELPADWYVITETDAPDNVEIDPTPHTVELKPGQTYELKLTNVLKKQLITFLISTLAGAEVTKVTTGSDGLAVLTDMQPGTYKVQEIAVPDGVILDPTPQTVEVVAGKPTTLTFVNDYEGGLKILKKVTQTGKPLKNVTFRITKPDGSLIGEYTTDANGEIFVELEPQTVVVRETRVPSGYKLDSTPRTVEIKPNETTVIQFENERLGSIVIHKIDADTDRGLYGAVFLLMDEDYHTIAQLVTDRDGYAELDEDIPDGVYYLREIKAPDGYTLDDRIKRIIVKNGSTEEILWENSKTQGQIQIIKKSADYNPITGKPAGSLLEGAIFEITRADTGVVVDRIVSDYRGVAASGPLPIGRYKIREITAPDYYQLNTTEFEVQLKVPNDVVQVEVLNNTANISTSVKKQGNTSVTPGQQMRYDFWDICNLSNVPLENFFWHDQIPTDAVRLNVIHTGTWNQPGLTYKVTYKTNLNSSYRDLATGLLTTQSYDLDCSASRLGLASNEYITDFRFEFGTVKAGFREENRPMILVTVLPNLVNGYRFANRTDVGGKYNDKWFTSDYTWVTQVIAPPIKYPTTGY